ncbi:hypothetical protein MBRU_15125 [Mycolicibacterium brumae DSM 44177]|nr:hypothetical protein MBRU_15125 [Mycolicibacterium brumae DSM 44177]
MTLAAGRRLAEDGHMADRELIEEAVTLASRAPSLHNSQPWRWLAFRGGLALFLDRKRIVGSTDEGGRQAVISCGVMLDHLRVAAAAAGQRAEIERFPDAGDPDLLATVTFTPAQPTAADRSRADAILARRTDRLPMFAPPEWDIVAAALGGAVGAPADSGVRLDVLDDGLRPELGRASSMTEVVRQFDPGYQDELQWWTTPFEYPEGIPRTSLVSAGESYRVEVNRSFPIEDRAERRVGVVEDEARILLLSTPGDTRADALAAGEALSEVLLECTVAGLATCPVTHLTELPDARSTLAELAGVDAVPQALIRVGRAPSDPLAEPIPLTPRRPIEDMLRFA